MGKRCNLCGRFTRRIKEDIGLPLLTGFPPDKPNTASSMPYAPFSCSNHGENFLRVQYEIVGFPEEGKK